MSILFTHAFQPIIDIRNKEIFSYEILLRGTNYETAAEIFEQIERKKLAAFDQVNRVSGLAMSARLGIECRINLNFTTGCIATESEDFVAATVAAAEEFGLSKKQLILEIKESELNHDAETLEPKVNAFRELGPAIAIDNFGAKESDLNMLSNIKPDIIKLDMNLLRNIDQNNSNQAIVTSIYKACRDLSIDIIAGGIESTGEFNFLKNTGIKLFQGHLFAKPCFESLPRAKIPT